MNSVVFFARVLCATIVRWIRTTVFGPADEWTLDKVLAMYENDEIHHFPTAPFADNELSGWKELPEDVHSLEYRMTYRGVKYRRILSRIIDDDLRFPPLVDAEMPKFAPAIVHAALVSQKGHNPPKVVTARIRKYAGPTRDFWGDRETLLGSDFFPWDDYSHAYDEVLVFDSLGRRYAFPLV